MNLSLGCSLSDNFSASNVDDNNSTEIFRSACYSGAELLWGQIVCAAVVFLGGFGNLLTLRALMVAEAHLHSANLLIMTLVGCDVVFCLLIVPVIATEFIFNGWIFGKEFCRFFPYVSHVCVGFSIELFVAIASNRYYCVCRTPQVYHQVFSRFNTRLIIAVCLLVPVLILLPPLTDVWGHIGFHDGKRYCTYYDKVDSRSFTIFVMITAIFIPISSICLAYSKIIITVFLRKLKMMRQRTLKPCDMKLLATTMSVFGTFLICYMPYVVLISIDLKGEHRSLHTALRLLTIFGPITHPFIYVLTNGQYRDAICAYVYCRRVPILASPSSNSLKTSRRTSTAFTSLSRLGGLSTEENFCTTYVVPETDIDEVHL